MTDQEFYILVKSNLNNQTELIDLFKKQFNDTKKSLYLYLLFKMLNNNFVDFNEKTLNYIDIFELAVKNNDVFLNGKNFYELDFNFVKLLSKIDINASNLIAAGTSSIYQYIDGTEYIDLVDWDKLEKQTYDLDYLIYMPYRFINVDIRVNYNCAKICYKLIDEKDYEKYIYKPFIDLKLSIGKDLSKYKKLSEYDKVMILRKYSSFINRKQ